MRRPAGAAATGLLAPAGAALMGLTAGNSQSYVRAGGDGVAGGRAGTLDWNLGWQWRWQSLEKVPNGDCSLSGEF